MLPDAASSFKSVYLLPSFFESNVCPSIVTFLALYLDFGPLLRWADSSAFFCAGVNI